MKRGDKLIRKAIPGFPAKYCTGVSHYTLLSSGQWLMCDKYLKINHSECKEQPATFQGFINSK